MAYSFGPGDQALNQRHRDSGVANSYAYGVPQASSERLYLNYPPPHNRSNPSYVGSQVNLNSRKNEDVEIYTTRTPSPTPSEHAMLNRKGFVDWKKMSSWRFWVRREWLWYYVILGILLVLVILISVYERQIVKWLQGPAETIKDLPAGWLIPIAIFFIISFPPLFGHEILAILCGVVWGLWIGFAITAAGTFLGEIGNFYAFRYCCRSRGEKLEKKDLQYGCLARMVRNGGFWIALVARYSAIPGHFTTAVFSTCGMGIFVFAAAAFLSLPKQFVTVYIGVILEESGTGTESTKDTIISRSVLAVTCLVTGVAMWYMYKKMDEVKGDVIYQRRKARQVKLERARSVGSSVFNPHESDSDLPFNLNPGEDATFQRWDSQGRASGYAGDPRLSNAVHAPVPKHAGTANVGRIPTYRTEGGGVYPISGERYASSTGAPGPLSAPTSRTVLPSQSPPPQRQLSSNSSGWDNTGQDLRGESYKLPTIHPHTPLSGGFTNLPVSANRDALQQQQRIVSSPLPPPLAPPPIQTQRSSNPYSPTSPTNHIVHSVSPTATGYPSSQQTISTGTSHGAAVTASPASQPYPVHSSRQNAPYAPTQYGHAFQPQTQTHATMQNGSSRPQSPAYVPTQNAFPYSSPTGSTNNPYVTDQVGTGIHMQETSGATEYYTPAHSRAPTEQHLEGRLPMSGLPPPEYRP